ncbi:ABC transporter ATP-binding protein [Tumebacillus permanentifrigoris]|uniref:ATP-binding cassette subfamily B protein AbcA/BmrA n=1 Tax=Tumebacillus permanentifrigoris TaxID=378543 RepID=A0A316DDH2_9BACL|nr:ABC transporter ATP-binding protein [Tumebacillus permanentifrigoris]PWK15582.1 ATP-binding cassette subfamily B protein AbcA/BmrA [Tumebacillus permanentifrigoris]
MNKKNNTKIPGFARLILDTNPPKAVLTIAVVLSMLNTLVGLTIPLFTKGLVNGFSFGSLSTTQITGMAVALLVQLLSGGVSVYLLHYGGNKIVSAIRERLWRKLLRLPVPYYDSKETGDTISRLTNDTAIIKGLVTDHVTGFFTGILSIIGALAFMFSMNWKMTLVILAMFPLTFLVMVPVSRKMYQISKSTQAENAKFTSVISRVVSEIRLVKSSGSEPIEYEKGRIGISNLFQFGIKEARMQAIVSPIVSFLILVILVTLIGFGGVQVSSGAMTAGELVAFIMYLFQIMLPITQIAQFFSQFQKAKGATESIIGILESEEEDQESGKSVENLHQPIVIAGVSFAYKSEEPILRDVSLTVGAGKVTAIVGPSGGGKTTLFSLLERFYLPSAGAIRLGDTDIREFSIRSWRQHIGYVSQESPILVGTIKDNLCYGLDRDISREEMEQAARMAYADGFIQDLPLSYETEVGERGIKLSGGQRQRIAIARALLRDPQILMLDEATSNLDSKSEEVVQQALKNLMKGRTTVVIAHRLSTVVDADSIVFVEKGQVTGVGTHEHLYSTHALYREFADGQLRMNRVEQL